MLGNMEKAWETFSEEQFYNDLTLNLVKTLELIPGLENINLEKRAGCEKGALLNWEQRQSCILPQDLKNFYLSLDGFSLTYDLNYAGSPQEFISAKCNGMAGELVPVGRLWINRLSELRRLSFSTSPCLPEGRPSILDLQLLAGEGSNPPFRPQTNLFLMDSLPGAFSVWMVWREGAETAEEGVWLADDGWGWHKLAASFSQYFRMMLYHHGLPHWQLLSTPLSLPPLSEQIVLAVAPHLISPEQPKKMICRNVDTQIDPNLFKVKHRLSKKSKEKKKYSK